MVYNKLKELRVERGWRQKDVAEKLGISTQVYGNYENWINRPDPETLCKMADLFGVTVDYILGREDETGNASWNGTTQPPAQLMARHCCDMDVLMQAQKALTELQEILQVNVNTVAQTASDGVKAQIIALIDELSEEQRQLLLQLAQQMAKK